MTSPWPRILLAVFCACTPGAPQTGTSGAAPTPANTTTTPPAITTAGEDWLIWWTDDTRWTTRWLRLESDTRTIVGERKALIVGDERLWQIQRADKVVDVKGCECLGDDLETCKPRGKMPELGLLARALGTADTITMYEASGDEAIGDELAFELAVTGGVDGRLFVRRSMNGYFCGAHGVFDTSVDVFDLARGARVESPYNDWWKALPEPLRRAAAAELRDPLAECDDDKSITVDTILADRLSLAEATLALDKGVPTISWLFSVDVPYSCDPAYTVNADGLTGLIPEAAPLGLAGPLPAPISAELATIGTAARFGFSRLHLKDRPAMLAAFQAAPEGAWPSDSVSDTDAPAVDPARASLDEGRKLTRAKNYVAAITAFDKAIGLDPALAAAYSGRGYARLQANDLAAAKTDFESALTRDPAPAFQAAVWFNLGATAERGNDPATAKTAYETSNTLRPTKQARAALEALAAAK